MKVLRLLCFTFALAFPWRLSSQPAERPNVVLIFMDDMGIGDLSCYGATSYRTPNLDKMAIEGTRYTNFITTQPVCSASRFALLTSVYPNRKGIFGALAPNSPMGIDSSTITIGGLLKSDGYATAALGKWHLGNSLKHLPLQHGFDQYYGIPYSNDMWPFASESGSRKENYPKLPLIEGNNKVSEVLSLEGQDKLTTALTERAVSFIEKNKQKPFFLYLAHHMVHVPLGVSEKFRGKSGGGKFADVMMEVDWSVGEVLSALKKNGLEKNTLVIFSSDNGPWLNYGNHAGSNGGFREGKGTTFEGGNRVPLLVKWPGHVPAGRVDNAFMATLDMLPSIASLCGVPFPKNKIDGIDCAPVFLGKTQKSPRRGFYYYYRKNSLEAVRRDNWKLVLPHPGRSYEGHLPANDGKAGPVTEQSKFPEALYDLTHDPGERIDVSGNYPEIVQELEKLANEARDDLGDDLTEPEKSPGNR